MALVQCNECGKEVSTDSVTCPNCGYPIKPSSPQQPTPVKKGIEEHKKESIIYFLDMPCLSTFFRISDSVRVP
ncbi:MAG TPA: zinc ribbon domain-containing protein, partial [Thermodesulfobacteriota bacterium]|nr:zinc ribbon domain-containing protein [Thermodesulfobacteriota bacterium]